MNRTIAVLSTFDKCKCEEWCKGKHGFWNMNVEYHMRSVLVLSTEAHKLQGTDRTAMEPPT